MRKILQWCTTLLFFISFGITLLVLHIPFLIASRLGEKAHTATLNFMCWCLLQGLRLAGVRLRFNLKGALPEEGPLIFVCNHQSMFDIPFIVWKLRKFEPKFIAKAELGQGIPSVSVALHNMGSVLIDRANPGQAIPAILGFGRRILQNKQAACIFPEGTRARDGVLKRYRASGLKALLQSMPGIPLVPVVVKNSWKLADKETLPIEWGLEVSLSVLPPISPNGLEAESLVQTIEAQARQELDSHS